MAHQRLTEIFLELIKIEALSGEEKPVAEYVKTFLGNIGLNPYEDGSASSTSSNTGNIVCKVGTGGNMILSSHMDTARSTQNVKPIIETDKITSDGTTILGADNRMGIAVLLYLAEKIIEENISVENFTLGFLTCEETTLAGSANIELDESIKYGFVFDSQYRPGKFINSSYGAASFNLKVIGKAAHSGIAPEKGVNSLEIAVDALRDVKFGRLTPESTFNIGRISGGSGVNVVPESLYLEGEFRSVNPDEAEKNLLNLKKRFETSASNLGGKIQFDWFWDFKPFNISDSSYTYKKISSAIEKVGLVPEAVISAGGSDANSYNARGIEAVNIGIGAQNPHANDEYIYLEDLENTFNIALELVRK
ncbi:MAG: M20/M25/M40 family metallo-hydrolase [Bacteroidetes bacterium]|nr:M20/M25/M40 family metallo-hydrolase [Bacteroidota bacterium]